MERYPISNIPIVPATPISEKMYQILVTLHCTYEEAVYVQSVINESKEVYDSHPQLGSVISPPEIKEAMEGIGCNASAACNVLLVFQKSPQFKKLISYSEIKNVIEKIGCNAEDAATASIAMKELNMSLDSQYPVIKVVMKKMDCSATDAIEIMYMLQQLSLEDCYSIRLYDKIKEAKDAIGCNPKDAVKIFHVSQENKLSFSYDEIKKTNKAIGSSLTTEDAIRVYFVLKQYQNEGIEPLFDLTEIASTMKDIDCNAREAANVLFNLQNLHEETPFLLSEIKKMKEFVGVDLDFALEIVIRMQGLKDGKVSKEKWHDSLKALLKHLKPEQVTELRKWLEENKTEDVLVDILDKMKVAEKKEDTSQATTTPANSIKEIAKMAQAPTKRQSKKPGGLKSAFLNESNSSKRKEKGKKHQKN